MKLFKSIFDIFYPNLCVNCQKQLHSNETVLCSFCINEIPLIEIDNYENNQITKMFYGKVSISKGYSLLYYHKTGITKQLINTLKYKNREDIGEFLGHWIGVILKEKKVFDDIDIIIPVPLHKKRIKQRGYNQITEFTKTLSSILEKPYESNILTRLKFTRTQTQKTRFDRFLNMQNTFELTDYSLLENKHILLVDDVLTTGATLHACCTELQKTKNINISIATIAFTEQN